MSKAMEKRVKILPGAEEQTGVGSTGAQPARGASDDLRKILAGHTRYRCINEDANVQPCNIIFPQSAYQVVVDHLSEDTSREHGGFLLGHEIYSGDSEVPTVEVIQAVPARHTQGTPTRLTFTEETWRDLDHITDQYHELGQKLERVGWYHSHPNISIFLSHYDLDVCTIFDRRRYPIALVVDPVRKRGGFFVRGEHGYAPQSAQGFYEKHDVSKESQVKWTNMTRSLQAPTPPAIRTGGTGAGAADRPPIRIETRKSRERRPGITFGRLALGLLLFVMAGALGLLTYDQRKTAQVLEKLSERVTHLESELKIVENTGNNSSGSEQEDPFSKDQTGEGKGKSPSEKLSSSIPASPTLGATALSIDPPSASLKAGQTRKFKVLGVGRNVKVQWSVQQEPSSWGLGKIDAKTGLYTTPPKIARVRKVTIIANVKNEFLYATVTLNPDANSHVPTNTIPSDSESNRGDVTVRHPGDLKGASPTNGTPSRKDGSTNKSATAPAQNNSNNSSAPFSSPAPTPQPAADQQPSKGGNASANTPAVPKNAQGANTNSADPTVPPKAPAGSDPGPDHKDNPPPPVAKAVFAATTSISPQS